MSPLSVRLLLCLFVFAVTPLGSAVAEEPVVPQPWSLQTATGETLSFPYAHEEPVILVFWASWCPYCKALLPHLQSIQDEYGPDGVTIYAIAFRDDGDPMDYLQSQGYSFAAVPGGDEVAASYGVYGTPGLLVFNADNELVFNLYDIEGPELNDADDLSHSQKAARKAPYWAAQLRRQLDQVAMP